MTDSPEQDYQDHLNRQSNCGEADLVEILTPQEIDEHIARIKFNRMSGFEQFRERFIRQMDGFFTRIN